MPPRFAYWTIIFGNQPTSFRAATREELLPTFKQIQAKHADAVMMWFAHGRLWRSEEEAQDARRRRMDERRSPRGPMGPRRPRTGDGGRPEWRDRPRDEKPQWKDRPRDGDSRPPRAPRPEFRGPKPEWKDRPRDEKPQWKDRPRGPKPEWRDRPRDARAPRPEGKDRPADSRPPRPEGKDRWRDRPVPPGGGERRGRDWRPGGEHKDPRDRFKVPRDVKRARFKAKLRRDHTNPKPPRKKKDEE
jgi:hypothetical protein